MMILDLLANESSSEDQPSNEESDEFGDELFYL